jgi:hypothetical protein
LGSNLRQFNLINEGICTWNLYTFIRPIPGAVAKNATIGPMAEI